LDSDQLKSHKVRRTEAYEAEHEVIEGRETQPQDETTVPVIEERLNVQKKSVQDEAAIVKEPVTETRTVEVPVTHEELRIERRPATGTTKDRPVQSATEFSVPVSREEVEVRKQPYVKEEVVVKKEPVTETKTVNETLTSERVRLDNE
jgi:uncharacterized protein (TIGR02271 family)